MEIFYCGDLLLQLSNVVGAHNLGFYFESRRMGILFKFGLIISIMSLFLVPSESAVASIDLGSEWMKVAVVNLKPGQSPISVAINEMSKRKSPALVAFQDGNRLVGEEAAGIIARYPHKVSSNVRDVIGKPYKYVKDFFDSLYLPFDLVEDSRGTAGIRIDDGVTVYTAEELVAMLLSYGIKLAESHSKVPIKDAVITVPPYFGQADRKGLLQAAQLADINVLSLINEHSGAALQYGIDKDFSNESRHVIFYDMGSSSTYAALVYFSAYNTKEYGKTLSVNQFQVKDVKWDSNLGGQNMEMRLVEYFASEFNKQVGNGVDVRKSPKAMAKLKKQVKRTKEILSANTMAPISVESLYDDRDFRSTITREKFEGLCGDLWEKALTPLKEVLKLSGLNVDELYAVELIGGATRVPKLQAKLQEFLGRKNLDKHLDADEAIVLGASLHAANLSDGIKLNRKLGMIDGSTYGFSFELDGPDLLKDESTRQPLVPRMKKLPSKMFRSITHSKDFEVSLAYEDADLLPPGVSSEKFAHYAVSGLTDASEKYASRNLSSPIKSSLHFSLGRSGILSLDRADAVIEISEWIEVPKKNLTVENSTTTPNISVEAFQGNTSEGGEDKFLRDDGISNSSNSNVEEQSSMDLAMEKKLKKRTYRVPLKIIDKTVGPEMSLSKDSFSEAKLRLEALDKRDAERRRTAELKNNLEGYIYATREKLESSEEIKGISTGEERQSFVEKLDTVQEWLYTDGEDANATEFQGLLDSLKAIGDPIFFRLNELQARPAASEHARTYLTQLQQTIIEWERNKSWLPKTRIDEMLSDAEKVQNWLKEREADQQKISAEMAAVAISQAGAVVAMGDPIPLTVSELVEAGPDGFWKKSQVSSENVIQLDNTYRGDKTTFNSEEEGISHKYINEGLSKKKEMRSTWRGEPASLKELPAQSVENQIGLVHGMQSDSVRSIEKVLSGQKGRKVSDLAKTIGVVPESEIGLRSASITVQTEYDRHQPVGTLKENSIMEGSLVEVLPNEDGHRKIWFLAKVLSLKDGKAYICYSEPSDEGSRQQGEWVELKGDGDEPPRIRIAHPTSALKFSGTRKRRRAAMGEHTFSVGDRVDAWMRDGWWEGVITDKSNDETILTVQLTAQEDKSVFRAWDLRPSLIWRDGQWVEWSPLRESSSYPHEGDAPQEKRLKLVSQVAETDPAVGTKGKDKIIKNAVTESGKSEEPTLLELSAKKKVFNVGKNVRDENKPDSLRTKRSGLQMEGSKVIFGVPKPGKKQKFMEVSKHYVTDKMGKINNGNDSVKFTKYLIPQGSGCRGWKNNSNVDSKGKQATGHESKVLRSAKPQTAPTRSTPKMDSSSNYVVSTSNNVTDQGHSSITKPSVNNDENISEKQSIIDVGSFPDAHKSAKVSAAFSSVSLPPDAPSMKKSALVADHMNKGKLSASDEKLARTEENDTIHNDNPGNSIPNIDHPRRSNRRIQPTSRLLEGLQSSMIISKIPAVSHDKGSKGQHRTTSSSRGNSHS